MDTVRLQESFRKQIEPATDLEQLLYVVMNSLQMSDQDKPWLNEAAPAANSPFGPQGIPGSGSPLGPMN